MCTSPVRTVHQHDISESDVNLSFQSIYTATESYRRPIVSVLPAQRGLYRRERAAGLYGNTAAFIARASTQIILPLIGGLVLALPVYWLVNLWADFVKYVIFVIVIELVVGCAVSQGTITRIVEEIVY